jgi:hypothetical protein
MVFAKRVFLIAGSFGVPVLALFLLGRLHAQMLAAGVLDLILGILFVVAYVRTAPSSS